MKLLHYLLGILSAFCLIFILLITSVEAVVYWTPGYFERFFRKYPFSAFKHCHVYSIIIVVLYRR